MVITIAHQKGGVGKTTLSLNLAYCLADKLRVVVADTDPQGSIIGLRGLLSGIRVVDLDNVLDRTVEPPFDVAIIDTPPYLSNRLTDLFAASDYVLIPTKAGILDAVAIRATVALLRDAQVKRPQLKASIVLSMVQPSSSLTDEVRTMLLDNELPLLNSVITQRVSYARSPLTHGVFGSGDSKAKAEVESLATEIIKALRA